MRVHGRKRLAGVACAGIFAFALSACTGAAAGPSGNGGDGGGGEGVPFGAGKDEWIAAFAGIEPIDLTIQTNLPAEGTPTSALYEKLADDIEEYSDGKVEVELVAGYSIADAPEVDDALADGRIDLGGIAAASEADEYPVLGDLFVEATTIGGNATVSSTLAGFGALNELAFSTPEVSSELADHGMALVSALGGYSNSLVLCREPWTSSEDLAGKQIRVSSSEQFAQIEAMGGSPVSIEFTDLFDALQRGVVDCAALTTYALSGYPALLEAVPYVISPAGDGRLAYTPPVNVVGADYSDLPLAAQQLIFDKFSALAAETTFAMVSDAVSEVESQATKFGGGLYDFDAKISSGLTKQSQGATSAWSERSELDGSEFEERYTTLMDEWSAEVEDLGYSTLPFSDSASLPELDRDSYSDLFAERVIAEFRPESTDPAAHAEALAP